MSYVNKILYKTAERLGLGDENAVIKKSDELLRVLLSKPTGSKLGDFARAVLCLDLSCTIYGIRFEKETALLLSGLKKAAYIKNLHMLEKVLNLDKPLSVSELCVQLSCTIIQDLAEQILNMFKEQNTLAEISHPQYVAAAVYTACKLKSVKVQKTALISISHLKPIQWKELETTFLKFAEGLNLNVGKATKKSQNDLHKFLEEHATNQENAQIKSRKTEEVEDEDYDVWKARILAAAKQAIFQLQDNEQT